MKKFAPKNQRNARRGFSVAEVIVALTVIVIVSAAAVVLIAAQIRADAKATRAFAATNMAENAIECFRYACDTAENEGEIRAAFESAFEKDGGGIGCGYEKNDSGIYEKNGLFAEIIIDGKTISVRITNAGGEDIVSVKNYKAG